MFYSKMCKVCTVQYYYQLGTTVQLGSGVPRDPPLGACDGIGEHFLYQGAILTVKKRNGERQGGPENGSSERGS